MHIDLTPGIKNKFLRSFLVAALTVAAMPSAPAQDRGAGGYQGPGVASAGAPEVGSRGGRQVDLRFYAGVSGVFDSSLQPLTIDAKGNPAIIHNLYGVEVNMGAYGSRDFKQSRLGLDYRGSYRRYLETNPYDGSDQTLVLSYMHQPSRRITLNFRETAGTLTLGNSGIGASTTGDPSSGLTRSMVFFDSRLNYLQSTGSLTWLQSARTSFTISGTGFLQNRKQGAGLTNSWGYDFTGRVSRHVSKSNSVGASYTHSHFEFTGFGMMSDANAYHGTFASNFARGWLFSTQAGIAVSEIQSPFSINLNPVMAALFGQRTVSGVSYVKNTVPSGELTLRRQFERSAVFFSYTRGVVSGNGFYATSRQESGSAGVSYTGLRKVSLSVDGGYYSMGALGQVFGKVSQYSGGGGVSYNLGRATHLTLRYDYRDQQISNSSYARTGSRVAFGLMFSPGNIPLSLW